MEYKDLFSRYGHYTDYVTHTINISVQDPATLKSGAEIAYRDKRAAESIKELESYLKVLRQYRVSLVSRYNKLETMPYTLKIKAERRKDRTNHVHYHIWMYRVFEDGTEQEQFHEEYPGTQRRKAIEKIQNIVSAYPGIIEDLSLEKSPWER